MDIIESRLTELYQELYRRQPGNYRIVVSLELLKGMGWTEGQLITKYNVPVFTSNIKESYLGRDSYQSDIWLVHEP